MPRFLKKQTTQRLDASKRMLRLAIIGLACPRHHPLSMPGENSAELGLIGSAGELALAAIVVEIASEQSLLKSNGTYYSAGEVLGAFRDLLKKDGELPACLGTSPEVRSETAKKLLEASQRFAALFTARAGALHTGQGASRDVCYLLLSDVLAFLGALRDLRDWKSSLKDAPECPTLPKERTMLVSELLSVIKSGKPDKAAGALTSIFLVAPAIPADEPAWIQPLARVMVRPRKGDVAMLLKTLEKAKVGELYKVGSDAEALAVRITDDEEAPAMSMQNAKTSLTRPENRFRAFVGTANGSLEAGMLELPSIKAVYELFHVLVRNPELLKRGISTNKLTAHEVWPVPAASLRYVGTPGPLFFILRQISPSEVGQLVALMKRAAELDKKVSKQWAVYESAITVVAKGGVLAGSELQGLEKNIDLRKSTSSEVVATVKSLVPRNLMIQDISESLVDALNRSATGEALTVLLKDTEGRLPNRTQLIRKLLDIVLTNEDVPAVFRCLQDESLAGLQTNARRALQAIDYEVFGKNT